MTEAEQRDAGDRESEPAPPHVHSQQKVWGSLHVQPAQRVNQTAWGSLHVQPAQRVSQQQTPEAACRCILHGAILTAVPRVRVPAPHQSAGVRAGRRESEGEVPVTARAQRRGLAILRCQTVLTDGHVPSV